jgi:SAM-dependent methyltransferase
MTEPRKTVADRVGGFYERTGWRVVDGVTEDARRWTDTRRHAQPYLARVARRLLQHLPERGEHLLDVGCGPLLDAAQRDYSRNFARRFCVDLSWRALESAQQHLGEHGVYLHGDVLDLELDEDSFDAAIALHSLYHVDAADQEAVVRKLLRVTRPGQPVIVVYCNPRSLGRLLGWPLLAARDAWRRCRAAPPDLYFHAHPMSWWGRFGDEAAVRILPWSTFRAPEQRRLFPDRPIGARMLAALAYLEERFPSVMTRLGEYYLVVLRKC